MKKTLSQCLKKCLKTFVKKTLADVRVRSDGQGNVSGFSIFVAIISLALSNRNLIQVQKEKENFFVACLLPP